MSGISYPKCYALMSGGKDSLSTAQVLHEAGKLEACVSLETGISTPPGVFNAANQRRLLVRRLRKGRRARGRGVLVSAGLVSVSGAER